MTLKLTLVFGSICLFSALTFGDESNGAKIPEKTTIPVAFPNYWDAESWEKGSTDNFWTATPEESRNIAPKREISPSKESKVWQRSK